LLLLLQVFFIPASLAHPVEIVGTEGKVLAKNNNTTSWALAQNGRILQKNTEIKTINAAQCIISFDRGLDNILALAKDTHLNIESVQPVKINLIKGDILFLIDDIKQIKEFKIYIAAGRTIKISAIAASISVKEKAITIKCFEDTAKIEVIGPKNVPQAERIIEEGFGIKVNPEATLGDVFELNDYDFSDWDEFTNAAASLRAVRVNNKNIQF
jgi:hypothetical protein